MSDQPEILVLNGPNLSRLGMRQPEIYGTTTLADIEALCLNEAQQLGMTCRFRQSNIEGEMVDAIHQAIDDKLAGIVINAGAYTHTSVALHDALAMADQMPVIEVHLSNIHQREEFRHYSYLSSVSTGVILGLGATSYRLAIQAVADHL